MWNPHQRREKGNVQEMAKDIGDCMMVLGILGIPHLVSFGDEHFT